MRHINQDLQDYFMEHITKTGVLVDDLSFEELVLAAYQSLIGVKEEGTNQGKIVEDIQSTVGRPEKQAYCEDTGQSCIAFAEVIKGVKSPLIATESCMELWDASHQYIIQPRRGALIVWNHVGTYKGHFGIVKEVLDANTVITMEGNTSADSKVDGEGDGFFEKHRSITGTGNMKVMGFLRMI